MNEQRLYRIIVGPHTTEKAVREADQIVLRVLKDANKTEIKKAVEKLFSVTVMSVRTVTTKGKTKQFKQALGQRPDCKKAYVRLAEGQTIQFESFQ